ncbi:MAG TPA: hypothetical protein VMT16_05800 [Thermoanaerobaculia bacterium]|nr:hypothetical protein [Thermoanaerobaculia bacterium]
MQPAGGGGEALAGVGSLRRANGVAMLLAGLGAAGFLVAGESRAALALTASAGVSIVGFRGLEGVVRRLQVAPDGGPGVGVWRFLLRLLLLPVLITALLLVFRDLLAVILGLTALPLALIVEAGIQLVALRSRKHR